MATALSKWLMKRYATIWKTYRTTKIDFDKIQKKLDEDTKTLTVVLSELKKSGWITIEKDTADKRRRVYQLRPPEEIVDEIADNN